MGREGHWGDEILDRRAENEDWSSQMRAAATDGAAAFWAELGRIHQGIELLTADPDVYRSFQMMNEAMRISSGPKGYTSWRPFQIGFLLANLNSTSAAGADVEVADIVWFATGGGKTETYLGLLVTAAFHDRITEKLGGITAWSRFPLRMLSLQQTQRFADAFAAAELVRTTHNVGGEPFSVGFFVGAGATPNEVKEHPNEGDFDPDDDQQVAASRVLLDCPFCHAAVDMAFNHRLWTLEHRCSNSDCPWTDQGLPFYIVDSEIYRFLPTVVVGTLDKAATIAWQAAMRGFVGGPHSDAVQKLDMATPTPTDRDEITDVLCRDAMDRASHLTLIRRDTRPRSDCRTNCTCSRTASVPSTPTTKPLFDGIQEELSGTMPKILASSATLAGFEEQTEALYRRSARVFPAPGPAPGQGFWTKDTISTARRFVGIAPRGLTTEFAVDRIVTTLQESIRQFAADPISIATHAVLRGKGICVCRGLDTASRSRSVLP